MSKKKVSAASTDMRVRRTHKLLWEALLALLKDHAYESITVQEICDKAMIHRTTFYNHFEDKDHLLQYGLTEIENLFGQKTARERLLYPIQTTEAIINDNNLISLMSCESNGVVSQLMYKHGLEGIKKDLKEMESEGVKFPLPLDIIAAFYSGARIALAAWWIENGRRESAAQIDDYLRLLTNQKLFELGEKPLN
ncbi:TetR/AcrR family transcriptional regulator [Paenibacillus protaetiae]|uniref:TetR/AcrR family transcriptional regulator n=1 Tax=Paenibacillus protaetiae TaxID=2509456 RepID=A0A4P6F8Y8_9BACL|nr:TetR/AcrR family transcriptional regulator [Paenibacillus protaetiae]QAY66918.1 TetR/AcrR family transcriptional regulator [Paenibacillus protaetiae]